MKNNDKQIIRLAEEKVVELFGSDADHNLVYHTIDHTRNVVKRVNEIAAHYELAEKDVVILNIAAWFHDTGHLLTSPAEHEQKSVELMKEWLADKGEYAGLADEIERVILATKLSAEPSGLIQEIIKDADTYHFGTNEFKEMDKLMKNEMVLRNQGTIVTDWKKNTLYLLESHHYYTSYCKDLLEAGKQKNMAKLKKKLGETDSENGSPVNFRIEGSKDKSAAKTKQAGYITKGIQTMLRLTSENHMRLSEMADRKANILISVNAIIISVSISVLFRKFETDPFLVAPTIIFLTSSVITIVLSILATRPTITGGQFSKEDITNKKVNLLFFGNFYKASLEDFRWGMGIMMRDPEYLYGSLIKDVYYLGVVLGKKYRLLRIAYNIFMVGVVISVIAFTIAVFTKSPETTTVITTPTRSPL